MKDATRRPDFGLYEIQGVRIQAKRVVGAWHVILPDGVEAYLSEFVFDDMAVRIDDADNR